MPGVAVRLPKPIDRAMCADSWKQRDGRSGPGGRTVPVQVPSCATSVCDHLMKVVPSARARNRISGAGTVLLPSCCGISRGRFGESTARSQARSIQLCLEGICLFCWCAAVICYAASLHEAKCWDFLCAEAARRGSGHSVVASLHLYFT